MIEGMIEGTIEGMIEGMIERSSKVSNIPISDFLQMSPKNLAFCCYNHLEKVPEKSIFHNG